MTGLRGRKSSKKADKPVSAVGDAIAKKKAAAADNNDDKVAPRAVAVAVAWRLLHCAITTGFARRSSSCDDHRLTGDG